ncbi:amino acid transporter [Arthrobacter sp. CAU 1506]|uniref:amino acid transporter n=1 Tax=Arthrobacter sp. CAU 1506 TaxID=2560052 RepID=UPI0010ABEF43|nr:amino acid transporter [Arthrobacter sp. CAU 1506]TJY67623.1 amino acid transporter [Arthrobacter sp. CAU 1506]
MTTLSLPPFDPSAPRARPAVRLRAWMLHDLPTASGVKLGPHGTVDSLEHGHPWWKVMCLTGVDYFSTLGYQPAIAALAAGAVSPLATMLVVLVTLCGALPVYRRVAEESPHGSGSIAMLERLLPRWRGKLLVLALLGFVATDFMITMTLSAADATAHLIENPLLPHWLEGQNVAITLVLLGALTAVFLRGFREAIGVAVVVVGAYLALNAVLVAVCLADVLTHPLVVRDWWQVLTASYGNPLLIVAVVLLVFPKLALGLSGFETGVAVMPQIRASSQVDGDHLAGRIHGTRRLLTTAALIMSGFLISSSFVSILLIPAQEFQPGGAANGRALAYLAHELMGPVFGSLYDASTIIILWFAGASAMAGLLNVVPRYLPRYGMAPGWTKASRPLVLVFCAIAFLVTVVFDADVDAQGGAYATGVLVLITSAAAAVTLSARSRGQRRLVWGFGAVTAAFVYTTAANIVERPEGIRIASLFILGIVVISFISRTRRSFELHATHVHFDERAVELIARSDTGPLLFIAHEPKRLDAEAYRKKLAAARAVNNLPADEVPVFLEVIVDDSSDFETELEVHGVCRHGYDILEVHGPVVPNTIASVLLHIRDITGLMPHVYFRWTEGNPISNLLRFLVFGEGEIAPVTREILREAEPDVTNRPWVHVG